MDFEPAKANFYQALIDERDWPYVVSFLGNVDLLIFDANNFLEIPNWQFGTFERR